MLFCLTLESAQLGSICSRRLLLTATPLPSTHCGCLPARPWLQGLGKRLAEKVAELETVQDGVAALQQDRDMKAKMLAGAWGAGGREGGVLGRCEM